MFVIRERHYAHSVYLYTVAMLGFFDARASKWPPLKGITIFIKSHLVIAYPVACVNSLKFAERRKPKLFSATIHFSALRPLLPGQVAPYSPQELTSGHTERGLPQRTAVSVRCGMLHSKQTLLTIIF